MELMLFVYGVSIVTKVTVLAGIILGLLVSAFGISGMIYLMAECDGGVKEFIKRNILWPKLTLLCLTTVVIVPSERTLQYMAGAYLIQSVYESTEAREIGSATKKAVMSQLEVWSKGNEQLLTLIEQIKPAVQEKVHDYSTIGAQQ